MKQLPASAKVDGSRGSRKENWTGNTWSSKLNETSESILFYSCGNPGRQSNQQELGMSSWQGLGQQIQLTVCQGYVPSSDAIRQDMWSLSALMAYICHTLIVDNWISGIRDGVSDALDWAVSDSLGKNLLQNIS